MKSVVNEQVLQRASEDASFRRLVLSDPTKALNECGAGVKRAAINEPTRPVLEALLDKASKDPAFRQQLKADPEKALQACGYSPRKTKPGAAPGADAINEHYFWSLIDYWQS